MVALLAYGSPSNTRGAVQDNASDAAWLSRIKNHNRVGASVLQHRGESG